MHNITVRYHHSPPLITTPVRSSGLAQPWIMQTLVSVCASTKVCNDEGSAEYSRGGRWWVLSKIQTGCLTLVVRARLGAYSGSNSTSSSSACNCPLLLLLLAACWAVLLANSFFRLCTEGSFPEGCLHQTKRRGQALIIHFELSLGSLRATLLAPSASLPQASQCVEEVRQGIDNWTPCSMPITINNNVKPPCSVPFLFTV